jgi:hypothetical protein
VVVRGDIGKVSATVSPLLQVRLIGTYAGPATTLTRAPLTVTVGFGHQPGMRRYSGNATGPGVLRLNDTDPVKGYAVLSVNVTVVAAGPTFAVTTHGAYIVAARPRSAVACHRLSVKYGQPCP